MIPSRVNCWGKVVEGGSVSSLVEQFLAVDKTLEGTPQWLREDGGVARLMRPVAVDGEISEATLQIRFRTRERPPKFRIGLYIPQRIWALDYDDDGRKHTNSLRRPTDAPPVVYGPHFHAWEDNKRFATQVTLPKRLWNARPLASNIRSFDSALRWFCSETRIRLRSEDVIVPPTPDTFI